MSIASKATLTISSSVAALMLAMHPEPASASNLFDILFGGPVREGPVRSFDDYPPAVRKPVKPAPAAKPVRIQGPGYNVYKADALVHVKIDPQPAAMTTVVMPAASSAMSASADPTPGAISGIIPVDFRDSVAALDEANILAEKDVAAALAARYDTDPTLIWSDGKSPNAKARDVMRVLADAGSQGLQVADYAVSVPADTTDEAQRKADMVRFDVTLSARALRYVRDMSLGRIDANRMSGYYDFPTDRTVDLKSKLDALAASNDPTMIFDRAHPRNAAYATLVAELKSLQATADDSVVVDPKLILRPGGSSPELPKLLTLIARKTGAAASTADQQADAEPDVYTPDKVAIVKAAQQSAGLRADGIVGPRTVKAFAEASAADRIVKVKIALEEMRWLPNELGTPRVFVNQPAFTASFVDASGERLKMPVVVGGVGTQTPFFYDEIEQVDYNPYWGVPASILVNEMLPKLRRDPGYLDRAGYEVFNSKGKRVPSSSVSWGSYGAKIPFDVRQTPSEANALGELKILFPNKNAIYMHDTPAKAFFKRDMRALSHGCIRLADPRAMAAAVLDKDVDYVAEKLTHGHSSEKVPAKIPVYISYFTAWPNAEGKVEYFDDVYGRDQRVEAAFEATEQVRAPAS